MAIHVGKKIQEKVEELRLTQKEFGEMINKNEKTVPNIFERDHMSTDLLLNIVKALKEDFFKHFYEEDPVLKSLRNDEVTRLSEELQRCADKIKYLENELALVKDLNYTQKGYLSVVKEQLEEYKKKDSKSPE